MLHSDLISDLEKLRVDPLDPCPRSDGQLAFLSAAVAFLKVSVFKRRIARRMCIVLFRLRCWHDDQSRYGSQLAQGGDSIRGATLAIRLQESACPSNQLSPCSNRPGRSTHR